MRLFLALVWLSLSVMGSTLHLSTSSNPSRLNPLLATDSSSAEIAGFLFNALVKYDAHGKIVGDLAQSYRFITPTELEFTLRQGVTWHDGAPFDARDVLFTYQLLRDPKTITPYASDFRVIHSVRMIDRYRVRITYTKPYFKALEIWMMGIVPQHRLARERDIMASSFNTHPIGTGPYRLKQLAFSKHIILEANPTYFEHRPKIDRIVFHIIADPMTRFLMLKSGQIDIDTLDPLQYERQLTPALRARFKTLELPSHTYIYLGFNLRTPPFNDIRVRQALSMGIDRRTLIDILYFNHGKECTGPFLPGSAGYNSTTRNLAYNPQRAKALLAQAGYDAKHPLSFEITTSSADPIRPYAAEILQRQLGRIGVKVHLRSMEWQAFLNTVVFPQKFQSVLLGWSLSISPDPYALWHSKADTVGGFNFIGYHVPRTDRLIEAMERSTDPQHIATLQRQIFDAISRDTPYLFLVVPNSITLYNRNITGIKPSINGIWDNYIDWEKR